MDTIHTPIDRFARDYLGLNVRFANLSDDGSICGLTAYSDTQYTVMSNGTAYAILLKENDVLLDERFISTPSECCRQCGKRRFTLAHECAHQILFRLGSEEDQAKSRKMYTERRTYSLRDLKCKEDWNEWQANALGAAILMPADTILQVLHWLHADKPELPVISYGGELGMRDRIIVDEMCSGFGVSRSALLIRLEQLGYCIRKSYSEFHEPAEVWM